jgi:uncharacterized protein (UPF0548 family)
VLVHPGRLSDERLARLAERLADRPLSHPHLGATLERRAPRGYRRDHFVADLGTADAYARAAAALRTWGVHHGAGARVAPGSAPVRVGQGIVVAVPTRLFTVVAPCRIVRVDDAADRFGFAYGTLVGHPEHGEESFHVVLDGDRVRFEIVVVWRPAHPLARLGGPVTRLVQRAMTRRYLAAARAAAAGVGAGAVEAPGSPPA